MAKKSQKKAAQSKGKKKSSSKPKPKAAKKQEKSKKPSGKAMKVKINVSKKKKTGSSAKRSSRRPKAKSSQGLTKIKVVGVGGAGGNIITRMRDKSRIRGVEYIAVNTDIQDLEETSAHKKIHIGRALTRGMGAGMNPDVGRQAAEENRSEIGEILKGTDIVFVAAGFGGGTGSGGGPVVAGIAKKEGILTIGIVTRPFKFEGSKRMMIAQEAIDRMKESVDALVIVPNDRIFSVIDKDTPILKAFAYVDEILKDGVEAIADLINVSGIINVDFSDIRTILRDMGVSMIGVGVATGQDRSAKVVQQAINSPLLENSIEGAKGVLFSIAGGKDLKMSEVNDIAKAISDSIDPNAQVIFGATDDSGLKDKAIKLTVIATGFNGTIKDSGSFNMPHLFGGERGRKSFEIKPPETKEDSKSKFEEPVKPDEEEDLSPLSSGEGLDGRNDPKSGPWDIPTFLRKKKRK